MNTVKGAITMHNVNVPAKTAVVQCLKVFLGNSLCLSPFGICSCFLRGKICGEVDVCYNLRCNQLCNQLFSPPDTEFGSAIKPFSVLKLVFAFWVFISRASQTCQQAPLRKHRVLRRESPLRYSRRQFRYVWSNSIG